VVGFAGEYVKLAVGGGGDAERATVGTARQARMSTGTARRFDTG
jgi:hypothetical protein